ncbi:MAG: hypothetical protein Q8L37_02975 [Candidatus Gottesmanbacteria bacterium]|nr:hypothetical protein [Candidatus Gottesmanbacteria bacterium]
MTVLTLVQNRSGELIKRGHYAEVVMGLREVVAKITNLDLNEDTQFAIVDHSLELAWILEEDDAARERLGDKAVSLWQALNLPDGWLLLEFSAKDEYVLPLRTLFAKMAEACQKWIEEHKDMFNGDVRTIDPWARPFHDGSYKYAHVATTKTK